MKKKKKKILDIILIVLVITLCAGGFWLYGMYLDRVYDEHPEGDLEVRLTTNSSWFGGYSWTGSMSNETVLVEVDSYVQSGVFGKYYYWIYDIGPAEAGTITLEYRLFHQSGSEEPQEYSSFYLEFQVEEDGTITQIGGRDAPEVTGEWEIFKREFFIAWDQFYGVFFYDILCILWMVLGTIFTLYDDIVRLFR